ncbi:bifunctional folylpolyglutamate synthase/dihydrofolate synthase [Candidatus Omnitrophota bacterium]
MDFHQAQDYLNSHIDYEKLSLFPYNSSFKLERILELLSTLNNPQNDLKCIHAAGTKGKGSTCAFTAYMLREAGFKVGLYTSPHLSDFRERIRILSPGSGKQESGLELEGMISKKELISLVEKIRPCIDKFNLRSDYGQLSFFEVYTAIAFLYFKQQKVDFCVLETGLGGRLDATNAGNSLISVITPISYEHTALLGNTLAKITVEKAGIIKSHKLQDTRHKLIVVSAPQEQEAGDVIRDRCKRENALLYELGREITFERKEFSPQGQYFNIDGILGSLADLKITLLGSHQVINAALAVAVILALNKFYQAGVSKEAIKHGLYNTIWPGRLEIVIGRPLVILDGAQNIASAQALARAVRENFPARRIILILGISRDKDIGGICKVLFPVSTRVILTQADSPRAADVDGLEQIINSQLTTHSSQISKTKKANDAIKLARSEAKPEDLILVTGSLFLVGEVRELLYN